MRQNEGMIRIFTWYALESSRLEFSDNVSKCVWQSMKYNVKHKHERVDY
jgi:hypothetical protein